jgi:hypothetical protein
MALAAALLAVLVYVGLTIKPKELKRNRKQ